MDDDGEEFVKEDVLAAFDKTVDWEKYAYRLKMAAQKINFIRRRNWTAKIKTWVGRYFREQPFVLEPQDSGFLVFGYLGSVGPSVPASAGS